jgi:hypothetical protein
LPLESSGRLVIEDWKRGAVTVMFPKAKREL